jgi:hypothetical protein
LNRWFRELKGIERDLKQQTSFWNDITGESIGHWIVKEEKHQERFFSECYPAISPWTVWKRVEEGLN